MGASPLPFTLGEFERRLERVRTSAAARGFDALIITTPENVYYLTGYQTTGFYVSPLFLIVPQAIEPVFVARYGERSNVEAKSWLRGVELYRDDEDPVARLLGLLQTVKPKRVGIEMESWLMTAAVYQKLLAGAASLDFKDCSGLVEEVRATKSPEELAYVQAAARISNVAMRASIEAVVEGKADYEIAAAVYGCTISSGSEYPSDPPDAIVGPQTAQFHTTWNGQRARRGDVVMLDLAGVVKRYLAPIARTVSIGEPPRHIAERYKIVLEALDAGIAAMRPGATCSQVYEAIARPITKAGYEIPIKAGYSVGIAFPPRRSEYPGLNLLPSNHTELRPGMVIHAPRTIRVAGDQTPICGDTVLVTQSGYTVLTDFPRRLEIR